MKSFCWSVKFFHAKSERISFCYVRACGNVECLWRHSQQLQKFYISNCDCSRNEPNFAWRSNGHFIKCVWTDDRRIWSRLDALMSCANGGRNQRRILRNWHGKMTVPIFDKQSELSRFSSYCIKKMTETVKFFPREKDRKPEIINEPEEKTKDVEKEQNNNNNWKKKSFNSKK